MNETINLHPTETAKGEVLFQGDWRIDRYCQLRANKVSRRASYREAYSIPDGSMVNTTLDSKIQRLEKDHPEIPGLVAHYAQAAAEEWDAKWWKRRQEAAEHWWTIYLALSENPKTVIAAAKAFEIVCMLLGWKSPEQLEVKAVTASCQLDNAQVESKVDRLLAMMSRQANQQTTNTEKAEQ